MLQKLVIKKEENKYFCGITYLRINKNLELNDIINTYDNFESWEKGVYDAKLWRRIRRMCTN